MTDNPGQHEQIRDANTSDTLAFAGTLIIRSGLTAIAPCETLEDAAQRWAAAFIATHAEDEVVARAFELNADAYELEHEQTQHTINDD